MINSDNKCMNDNKESIPKEYKTQDMIEGEKERKNKIIKEYIKNMNEEDFLYLSEHLKIRIDNEIFMSQELNDYINKHIDIICELHFKNFKRPKTHMKKVFIDLTLKLKYLRHLEYLKRKKKKDKENKSKSKKEKNNKNEKDDEMENKKEKNNKNEKDDEMENKKEKNNKNEKDDEMENKKEKNNKNEKDDEMENKKEKTIKM
ncbi:hypothetical protein PFHG_05570, partial [Plasmodium falciparum HB3]